MKLDELIGDIAVTVATFVLGAVLTLGTCGKEAYCGQPASSSQVQASKAD